MWGYLFEPARHRGLERSEGYLGRGEIRPQETVDNNIIIIFIKCSWVDTRWQRLFYMHTKYDIDYYLFKSGGLHEKHVVATWKVGNPLSICL
jgi:hypothetical protein